MKKIFILIAATAIFTSCASIICGSTQSVTFNSTPSNATISDNGVQIGQTPLSAKLTRKENHAITIELEGYQQYEIMIKKSFNGWYLGNIIFGGLIGLVVDPLTGAIYQLTPTQVNATFGTTAALSAKNKGNDIYIAVSLTPDPSWKCVGMLTAL